MKRNCSFGLLNFIDSNCQDLQNKYQLTQMSKQIYQTGLDT